MLLVIQAKVLNADRLGRRCLSGHCVNQAKQFWNDSVRDGVRDRSGKKQKGLKHHEQIYYL